MADRWADSSCTTAAEPADGAGPAREAAPTSDASGADAAPEAAHEASERPTHNTVNAEKIRRRVDEYRASVRERSDREKHAATKLSGYCARCGALPLAAAGSGLIHVCNLSTYIVHSR